MSKEIKKATQWNCECGGGLELISDDFCNFSDFIEYVECAECGKEYIRRYTFVETFPAKDWKSQ